MKITIPKQEVLHYMRYNTSAIKPSIEALIDALMVEVESLNYKYNYIFKDISVTKDSVTINNNISFVSTDLASFLRECDKAVFLGVSLSTQFERKLSLYQRTDALKAMIYDACGSAFVEAICDELSRQFEQETNLYSTSRYSPGYGDLALEEQKKFYRILSLEKMGVELTESNLMIPRKTVTAIIGLTIKKQQKTNIICDCDECVIPCRKLYGGTL